MSLLANKYRPKLFEEVTGQCHIPSILLNQVKNRNITNSYIFKGPKGSGKTTSARILAKAINCLNPVDGEPCLQCENCKSIENNTSIDIYELDAASNNGIDNIREIIDSIRYAPSNLRYKVYIIDEAHRLSAQAADAFLKTLEEPPSYVVFILATTDANQLPATIRSRCQLFDFRRIAVEDILTRLKHINLLEKCNLEEKSLMLIAKLADGALRDAVSLLEKVISSNKESYEEIVELLGVASNEICLKITNKLIDKKSDEAVEEFYKIIKSGKSIEIFLNDLMITFRNIMLVKCGADTNIIAMNENYIKKVQHFAKQIDFENIFEIIDILQDAESKLRRTSQTSILVEMTLIKISRLNKNEKINNDFPDNLEGIEIEEIEINSIKNDVKYNNNENKGNNALLNQIRMNIFNNFKNKSNANLVYISNIINHSGFTENLDGSLIELIVAVGKNKKENDEAIGYLQNFEKDTNYIKREIVNEFDKNNINTQFKLEIC
ncbi:DNA polymerase III subunit gamma/tau [Clostridioides difficile]|uniref:DNA polymerase III subunit gamma/tau n=1 Tax=Clostridioides sp. ZZV15-6598 TaxID=2811501 RepID=UPI001D10ED72|nr:DNA polymerase III subunit gamma/tau [Clostridioides sp. ZZV15-6598]MDB3084292.1 DNA polymerase III subunit gamma/tau [Clostridioides difficile]